MIEILVHNLLSCELGLGKLISHSGHSFSLGTGPVCHWQMYLNVKTCFWAFLLVLPFKWNNFKMLAYSSGNWRDTYWFRWSIHIPVCVYLYSILMLTWPRIVCVRNNYTSRLLPIQISGRQQPRLEVSKGRIRVDVKTSYIEEGPGLPYSCLLFPNLYTGQIAHTGKLMK